MKSRSVFIVYLFLLLSFLIFSITLKSQGITNKYLYGNIETGNVTLEVAFSITSESGKYVTKMYVPKQFVYGMKAESYYQSDSLKLSVNKLQAEFNGVWIDSINSYKGTWHQGQQYFPTVLKSVKKNELSFLERPQTPQPPFPYIEKEICIENKKGASTLCGTLTLPDESKEYPLVIMITGSGAQDRNEEIVGHQPFKVIADYLTKCGYAVYRYDDRGFGKSKGDMRNATSYDFMTDAASVLHFFGDYPNINSESIGILGHSEGGMIAWMLAAKYPKDVAFVISLAGPGIDIVDLMYLQSLAVNMSAGITEEDLEWIMEMQKKTYQIAINAKNSIEVRQQITALYEKYGQNLSEEKKAEYGMAEANINGAVMQLSSPWLKYFLQFKPSKYLKKIKCPILALNGTRDIQVTSKENLKGIEESINPRKCKELEIHEIDGLNHLFQTADDGTVQEYYYLQETFSVEALKIIEDFISRQN